jgi:predicted ATPase
MHIYRDNIELDKPKHLGEGKWYLNNLNQITILFGKNGSGKSLLLRSIANNKPPIKDGNKDSNNNTYHYIFPERQEQ